MRTRGQREVKGRIEGGLMGSWMDGWHEPGKGVKCRGSPVTSGDRSPAGMISAAVIDSFPPALR